VAVDWNSSVTALLIIRSSDWLGNCRLRVVARPRRVVGVCCPQYYEKLWHSKMLLSIGVIFCSAARVKRPHTPQPIGPREAFNPILPGDELSPDEERARDIRVGTAAGPLRAPALLLLLNH
jgi:hypothetical protein